MYKYLEQLDLSSRFITFEGGEGSGKTTVIHALANYMASIGIDVMVTREPGGVRIAEEIRSLILNVDNTEMDGHTEVLLYASARRQHLIEKIIPALLEGKVVLCDRYVDSSIVYQGYARGIGTDEVIKINDFAIDNTYPDLTIYLDIRPEVGLARIAKRTSGNVLELPNRLDLENLSFHKKVRDGYLLLCDKYVRVTKVNAEQSEGMVLLDVIQAIKSKFGNEGIKSAN